MKLAPSFSSANAMQDDIKPLWEERKLHDLYRSERPRCGARTRKGTPCKAQALKNGRCFMHGGLSTGPRTEEGKAAQRKAARAAMQRLWARWKAEGRPPLSVEGRKRISEGQKRRWKIFKTPRRFRGFLGMPVDAPSIEDLRRQP